MRKGLTLLSILMLLTAAGCQQAPFWFEGETFEAAQEQARAENKLILIDFYSPT